MPNLNTRQIFDTYDILYLFVLNTSYYMSYIGPS